MSELKYCLLDYCSESELLDYEKKLYNAFYKKYLSNMELYDRIWIISDTRLRSKIEYSDHLVYVAKSDTEIVWSISVNMNTKCIMQLEEMGFSISNDERNQNIGEVLTLFTLKNYRINPYKFTADFIKNYCFTDLHNRGIKKLYTTCSKAHLKLYIEMGFELKEQQAMYGEDKYLIWINISD